MKTVAIVVMAHPSRQEWAEQIAGGVDAEIVWDQVGEAWDTGKRALQHGAASGADYVCVLQDDIILSDGFLGVLGEIVQYCGIHPVGLYAGQSTRSRTALALDPDPWWASTGPIWGPGVVVPSADVASIVRYGDNLHIRSYDTRLWRYYQSRQTWCWYTCPSLVQHRTGHGSLISRGRDRQAAVFGSGVGLDWSKPPIIVDNMVLHPRVMMGKDGRRKQVRRNTRAYRMAVAAGWAEEAVL